MSTYLIKTIKLPDYINPGDHLCEEDWLYVDPDKINTINILGKEFVDSSVFEPTYEQGLKDALDKEDETFRIASYIRVAMGCETAKDCWELIRTGEIQRVKHGRWIYPNDETYPPYCSECKQDAIDYIESNYCPNCGAKMDEVASKCGRKEER